MIMDAARALLNGATELHVHSSPDVFPRLMNHAELAQHLKEYGYRAVVLKCHCQGTADRIPFVRELVKGIEIYGSISLNYPVGGLNPFAVDTALQYGAKVVWLPTVDAENHIRFYGGAGKNPLAESTKLPRFYSEAKGISVLELMGRIPLEKQQELVRLGAKIEYPFVEVSPKLYSLSPKEVAFNIKTLGPENVLLTSDSGQLFSPPPGECMRLFVTLLLEQGVG